ncbi:MAG TPA: hypothetical protein VF476_08230, partial [Chitinophagaceae bacterium]
IRREKGGTNKGDILKDPEFYLPGATECKFYTDDYFAIYKFPDSVKAAAFVREIKGLVSDATKMFGVSVNYSPLDTNPDYLYYYLVDSAGVLNSGSVLIFNHEPKGSEVIISVGSAHQYGYFTSKGPRLNNAALTDFIQAVAIGNDPAMKKIIGGALKPTSELKSYTSKRTVPGYKAFVYISEEEKIAMAELEKTIKKDDRLVEKQLDSLIQQLKAALPPTYYYYTKADEQVIYFYKLPYLPAGDDAEVRILYGVDPKRPQLLSISIEIQRNF